jgi:hypothetical protein
MTSEVIDGMGGRASTSTAGPTVLGFLDKVPTAT